MRNPAVSHCVVFLPRRHMHDISIRPTLCFAPLLPSSVFLVYPEKLQPYFLESQRTRWLDFSQFFSTSGEHVEMDLMRLLGAFIAVLFHPVAVSKINGQRICRRGTERPCYKVTYIQDFRRRLTFEDARRACQSDGGELLSIETESEQRLIERFIKQLQAGDGDFWLGLRRNPHRFVSEATSQVCPSQYYWLDGSKAKFRNWHWDEPSCGSEMCVVLYHQPSAPPDEEGHFLFQWNDDNCNSKNNYVCKYTEKKAQSFTEQNTVHAVPTSRSKIVPTTEFDHMNTGLPESSGTVSLTDNSTSYILYATIPALLLALFAVAGFFCYKNHVKRQKTEIEGYPGQHKQWMSVTSCPVQGPYAFSDITKLPPIALDCSITAGTTKKHCRPPPMNFQSADYENVPCANRDRGFVTNDIYESCRAQSQRSQSQAGWVENEIYGWAVRFFDFFSSYNSFYVIAKANVWSLWIFFFYYLKDYYWLYSILTMVPLGCLKK